MEVFLDECILSFLKDDKSGFRTFYWLFFVVLEKEGLMFVNQRLGVSHLIRSRHFKNLGDDNSIVIANQNFWSITDLPFCVFQKYPCTLKFPSVHNPVCEYAYPHRSSHKTYHLIGSSYFYIAAGMNTASHILQDWRTSLLQSSGQLNDSHT